MAGSHRRRWTLTVAILVLACWVTAGPIAAQDEGPTCPEGFEWQRMSGVGCVQIGCTSIPNAKLSYTRACICQDGFKACHERVDSSGANCGPNCPFSRLVACVPSGELCPGEEPTAEPDPEPTDEPAVEPDPQPTSAAEPAPTGAANVPPDDDGHAEDALVADLAAFLAGEGVTGPTAGQAAAGGVALSTLIATWVLINALSGTPVSELLQAVGLWGQKPGGTPSAGAVNPAASQSSNAGPQIQQAHVPAVTLSTSGTRIQPQGQGAHPLGPPAQPPTPTSGVHPVPQSTPPTRPGPADEVPPTQFPPDADPLKVQQLTQRFQQMVAIKIRDGYYVRNTGLINKIWNQTIGRGSDLVSGHTGGQCGDFAEWGVKWSEPIVREIFGDAAIVDTIYIGETSTRYPDGFLNAADALYEANHAATRVILPTGESYVLDYWAAIGDQQMELGTDAAHQLMFGEPRRRDQIQLIPEKEWIATWKQAIGPNDSEAHNMHYAMSELQSSYRTHFSEAEAIQAWRNQRFPGVPPHQQQTIINNWHRNSVHWERP